MTTSARRQSDPADEAVRVITAAVREAAQYGDDSVALGWLMLRCRLDGHELEKIDARDLIRAARGRPRLQVMR